ncbi:MAG: hypothetical protein V1674_03370 [Candidatus Omnitrophota bacterium]
MKIEKETIEVIVLTQYYRIEGTVHILPGGRITDFISSRNVENFIPVTNAKIYSTLQNKMLYHTDFLNLNTNFIALLLPKKNVKEVGSSDV